MSGLEALLDERRIWRGRETNRPPAGCPSGHDALDAALPSGGWPEAAVTEILLAGQGFGELALLWPALARLSQVGERVVLVAPPCLPYPHAWARAGVVLERLALVAADERDALWAAEQCLRSGSCGAVLCWPRIADDRALRRLQVAAESGQTLAFVHRPLAALANPSPAALRLVLEQGRVRVLKCRGGLAPPTSIAFARAG